MNFAAAILYAMSSSVLLAIILGFARGGLTPASAACALLGGLAVALGSLWTARRSAPAQRPRSWEWFAVGLFAWFTLRAFVWLVTVEGDEIKTVVWNNCGDLSLHVGFIRYIANGAPFWPESPILAGGKLTYSIGADFFNSLLVLIGMDVYRSLIVVGVVCSIITGMALWRWGRGFTLMGFLCNGGLAAAVIFLPHHLAVAITGNPVGFPETGVWPLLVDFQNALAWKSIPLAMFITQRGFLFALPAGLLLLCSWRARFFRGEPEDAWRLPVWGEVLLYASLPIFHIHTFAALSFMLAAFWLARVEIRRPLAKLVAVAFIPATLLVWLTLGTLKSAPLPEWNNMAQIENPPARPMPHVLGWKPGWMVDDDATTQGYTALGGQAEGSRLGRFIYFWALNFGIAPLLALSLLVVILRMMFRRTIRYRTALACAVGAVLIGSGAFALLVATVALFVLLRRLSRDEQQPAWPAAFVLPALYLFLLGCTVKFAPWEWDNTKVLIWAYLIVLPFLWDLVIVRFGFWTRAIVCELLFFSGLLTLLGGLRPDMPYRTFASRTELELVERAVRDIPITEPILAHPTYNHPLMLVGRRVTLGYPAHIASHGLDPRPHAMKVDSIMRGDPDWRIFAAQLGARYLFWGPMERSAYGGEDQAWRFTHRIRESYDFELYDLDTPALPVDDAAY